MANLPPAEVIASWPTPNYIDPVTRGPDLLIVSIVFTSLAFVLTSLRIYTRLWITGSFGVDDLLGVVALLASIAMCTVTSLATSRYGWDRHVWDVPLEWIPDTLKMRMAFQITFSVASTFTKLSLLWFCRRILGTGIKGPFRVLNYCLIGSMVMVLVLSLIFILLTIFTCIPIKASFDLIPTYSYHCLDANQDVFIASVVNIFTDFLTTVVPMPLIWRLKLPLRQRIAVIAIFGLGITVNIAGSVRTYFTWKDMIGSNDETWYAWPVAMAGAIEINLGILCASAPALRPLIISFVPHLFPSMRGTSYGQSRRTPKPWISTARSDGSRVMISSKMRGENDHDDLRGFSLDGIVRTVEMETFVEQGPHPSDHGRKPFGAGTGAYPDHASQNHMGGVQVHYVGDGESSTGSRSPDRFKAEDEAPFAYAT